MLHVRNSNPHVCSKVNNLFAFSEIYFFHTNFLQIEKRYAITYVHQGD